MYKKQLTDMIMVSLKYFFSIEPYLIHQMALVLFLGIISFRQVLVSIPNHVAAFCDRLTNITTFMHELIGNALNESPIFKHLAEHRESLK